MDQLVNERGFAGRAYRALDDVQDLGFRVIETGDHRAQHLSQERGDLAVGWQHAEPVCDLVVARLLVSGIVPRHRGEQVLLQRLARQHLRANRMLPRQATQLGDDGHQLVHNGLQFVHGFFRTRGVPGGASNREESDNSEDAHHGDSGPSWRIVDGMG